MINSSQANTRASDYFRLARERFDTVASSPGAIVALTVGIAGFAIRIEVAAGELARAILSALSHIIIPDAPSPDLTIQAWDSETTGVAPLSPAWTTEEYGREGFVEGFNDERFHTAIQMDPIIFRMLDMHEQRAVYWTKAASTFPYWEVGAPLRPLLHEWLRRKGVLPVHGGAVGYRDGGVLIAGAGGQGKSNVALACLASELMYASDDFCCVSRSLGWTVHSLYCTGKIAPADIARHPHLAGASRRVSHLEGEKVLFFLKESFPQRLIHEMPLRAIVLPRIVGSGPCALAPLATAAAQRAIATSTIEMSRWTARDTFKNVAELVRDLPCYELRVGASIAEVPLRLSELLRGPELSR